jgi:hypothetical protein
MAQVIATFANLEDGVRSDVWVGADGRVHVQLIDTDAGLD